MRRDLAAVEVPALVVAATGDRFIAPPHAAELAAGIAGARLVEVSAGHAFIFESPQAQEVLLGFLEGLE